MIILGLGCNIGDRLSNLRDALARIRLISELKVNQVSPVYESDALLPENAPESWNQPYLNIALSLSTKLKPEQLLTKIKTIEEEMGRVTSLRWAPRIMDIDILAWGDEHCHADKLKIPHLSLTERPFALWPLADLVPTWKYCAPNKAETGKTAKELIKKFGSRFDGKALFHTRQIAHRVDTPIMMGILNLTPDSFSDGGQFNNFAEAIKQTEVLFDAGADIIDIGAESTRPTSKYVTPDEEWSRLRSILETWLLLWNGRSSKPKLSVYTRKPEIVEKLLSYPIDFFNDVGGLTDPKMQDVIKDSKAKVIFMHSLGIPPSADRVLAYDVDAVSQVYQWGERQLENLTKIGINKERLIFDVGIGFGKVAEQSLEIIKRISQFRGLGVPISVGHSRKSFLSQFTSKNFAQRDLETAAISGFLATQQVDYLRVHNVDQNMRLLKVNAALCNSN